MPGWTTFEAAAPDIAAAGLRLLKREEVALLATVSPTGRPRIHPFVPKVVRGRLVAFILGDSLKGRDLQEWPYYAMHAVPGPEDEEFYVSGRVVRRNEEEEFRAEVDEAMGFATGSADDNHILYELEIERALWTVWLDFGTSGHRPRYRRWSDTDDTLLA